MSGSSRRVARVTASLFGSSALLLLASGSAGTQPRTDETSTVSIDHRTATVVVAALTPLETGQAFPTARARAARVAAATAPRLFLRFISDFPLHSAGTVGDAVADDPRLLEQLSSFAARPRLQLATLDRRLSALRTEYRYPMVSAGPALRGGRPLVDLFVTHTRASDPPTVLGFQPSRPFTGVLIFVPAELPARGKLGDRPLQPALLPKVYDEDLEVVYASIMVAPDALRRWGMVRYGDSLGDASYLNRIGVLPLQVMARGLYGELDTDIVISNEAARTLLGDPRNRQLLREGRVVVVVDRLAES